MWVNKKKWVNRGVIESQSVSPCHQTLSEPFTRASVNFLGYNSCSRLLVQTSIQTPVLRLPKGRIRGGGRSRGGGGLYLLSHLGCVAWKVSAILKEKKSVKKKSTRAASTKELLSAYYSPFI